MNGRQREFTDEVGREAARKLEARADGGRSFWESLSLLGAVGWVVVVPAVAGAFVGRALDRGSGKLTWTLALMLLGLVMGAITAWTLIKRR